LGVCVGRAGWDDAGMKTTVAEIRKRDFDVEMACRGDKCAIDRLIMRERECREHVEPYIKIKTRMMNLAIPRIVIYPDGKAEHKYNWTPEQKKALRLIDEAINSVIESYGFATFSND